VTDDALAAPFRRLDDAAVAALARDGWGIEPVEHRRLDTERDDTVLLTTADGVRRIIKVAHPLDDAGVLDLQCAALAWAAAADPGLPLPHVVPDRDGALLRTVEGADGEPRLARVLDYLPGGVLDYDVTSPRQREAVGVTAGRLSQALAGLEHPASQRYLPWDLQQVGTLRDKLVHVPDAESHEAVVELLDDYDTRIGPGLRASRQQIVHQDLNPDNVLVDPAADAFVTGVLDFGDIVRSSVVGDLAVAMTYAVDSTPPDADPWGPAYDVARGFVSVRALTDDERVLLPDLLRTRLAQRLLLNSWLAASDPSNAHYTARTVHRAVVAIQRLRAVPPPDPTVLVKES
jgi:hydroxylysine kinase